MTQTDSPTAGCCTPAPKAAGHPVLEPAVPKPAIQPPDLGLIPLCAATFAMGADDGAYPQDGEGPAREVALSGFGLSATTITNADYDRFIHETGYVTQAEREGASFVFHLLVPDATKASIAATQAPWWRRVEGASWRWPTGPDGRGALDAADHPVVHIALPDAMAYCQWSGTRLPTEAQWEYAARGGLQRQPYPWGNTLEPDGKHRANLWQGTFPHENTAADGHIGTAPARSYEPNGFGFYAMTGNVWEWTQDRFTTLHAPRLVRNPKGPLNGEKFVAKGGSYLCHASYCSRYHTSSRQALDPLSTAGNLGFRVAAL